MSKQTLPTHRHNPDPQTLISWFDDLGSGDHKHAFLSNFFDYPVQIGRRKFANSEVAFAAAKAKNQFDFEAIANMPSPGQAKAAGRRIALRPDWEAVKIPVMRACLRAKFERNTAMAEHLLLTGEWTCPLWDSPARTGSAPS
jgi:predicted NAD-dependent protein-ADP-ribosyltransferase YbiA (DUF1768 family)